MPEAVSSKDVYILREVLHDWNDDQTLDILRNVRTAIGAHKEDAAPDVRASGASIH